MKNTSSTIFKPPQNHQFLQKKQRGGAKHPPQKISPTPKIKCCLSS